VIPFETLVVEWAAAGCAERAHPPVGPDWFGTVPGACPKGPIGTSWE
jgi:hypothetical protein